MKKSEYMYYVVEHSFIARVGSGTTERLTPDGEWVDYDGRWEVLSNGRLLKNEIHAFRQAKILYQTEE